MTRSFAKHQTDVQRREGAGRRAEQSSKRLPDNAVLSAGEERRYEPAHDNHGLQ
ncbi:uncharacterized protein ANIA_11485 [Aspergillus nidulans FGSC A4]|uniref:Uncharacterized protein n=1 Tax=Emericella nidulans (strain FGSC A4 / ATCC 38163 / CBS 112.46 / NRRL 194 / M139) TaxID=227321 RepID=C8VFZ7_EMENI|nr:hypothetical protein [Aspergillus nidulans FGSC A4]CBF81572.1 TPA: hypothetical protein ANIA_11485 [Aspergillus nidulans FGSC A4]